MTGTPSSVFRARRPYEEVKEDIRNVVYQLKTEEAYLEWIKEQKDKSYIEIRR